MESTQSNDTFYFSQEIEKLEKQLKVRDVELKTVKDSNTDYFHKIKVLQEEEGKFHEKMHRVEMDLKIMRSYVGELQESN